MQVELIDIHRRLGLTTVFVTHDQDEALSLSDRVVLMNAGRVEQEAAPREIYDAPATTYASAFLGAANLVPAEIEGNQARLADGQMLAVPAGHAGKATLALRQENLAIDAGGQIAAKVVTRVYLGSRNRYILDLAGQRVSAFAPADLMLEPGADVRLAIAPERIRVLPA